MKNLKRIGNAVRNLAVLKADFEEGLITKAQIARKHRISPSTLWRYSRKHGGEYACERDRVTREYSSGSARRLDEIRNNLLEEHLIELGLMREELTGIDDLKELRIFSGKVDNLIRCIRTERLSLGLPYEITSVS